MKRSRPRAAAVLLALALAAAGGLAGQQAPDLGRTVEGVVLNALNRPLSSAIVRLTNMRTKVAHSVVTDAHGAYAFHHLQPNVTYEVYAEWQGHRSQARTASRYSSREVLRLDLTVPVS